MDSVEASGKSIDDAILQALSRLGRRRDEVEVAVLQEPSRGHRGVGAREARVRVWLKQSRPRGPQPERSVQRGAVLTPDMAQQWLGDLEDAPQPPPAAPPHPPAPRRTASIYHAVAPMPPAPVDEDEDEEEGEFDDEEFEEEIEEEELGGAIELEEAADIEEMGGETAQGAAPDAVVRHASEIVRTILRHMNILASVEVASRDPLTLNIRIGGDASLQPLLIGRRGETLASLQLLTNLILNRKAHDRYHVLVDVEFYRRHRDENLRSLALRVAQQVQRSQRAMMLEPMTPYERRIVHLALQESPYVQTQSTGEGDQRRVVVSLKPQH
jgi:spoIIIJ-associated protein